MANLDFVILKINNNDISQMPKNDVVQMFLYSEEPLVLEVRRKQPTSADITLSQNSINNKLENFTITNDRNKLEISSASETLLLENELVLSLNAFRNVAADTNRSISKTTQTDAGYVYALDHHLTKENAERIVEQEHNIFEQCLESEIDIEEITLRKRNSNESLGLTVCYSSIYSNNGCSGSLNNNNGAIPNVLDSDSEMCSDVYISDIQPDSVAGRDGRLRQGDQILQINGKDVKNKDETEALIAENNNAVTLLVSRYLFVDDDDFNDPCCIVELNENDCLVGEEDDEEDDLELTAYENGFLLNKSKSANDNLETERNNVCVNLSKMSLDAAAQTKESSETSKAPLKHTATITKGSTLPTKCTMGSKNTALPTILTNGSNIKMKTLNKDTGQSDNQKYKTDFQKFIPSKLNHLKLSTTSKKSQTVQKCLDYEVEHIYETIPEDSESEPFYCSPYETSMYLTAIGSCSSGAADAIQIQHQNKRVAQWLGIKNHAFPNSSQKQVQRPNTTANGRSVGKSETIRSAFTVTTTSGSSSSGGGGSNAVGATLGAIDRRSLFQEDHENSSSAYNTGGSNNSAAKQAVSSTQNCDAKQKLERFQSSKEKDPTNVEQFDSHPATQATNNKTTYNFDANFSHPIFAKQQVLKQVQSRQTDLQFTAPNLSQYHFVSSQEVSAISTHAVQSTMATASSNQKTDEQMVWKVKRRPDGTRYIVRRPARKYLLKERSLQLAAAGTHIPQDTTTEDDTISEVKIGRYWPKEERKKHIERAKERRLQQHQQQQQENSTIFKPAFALTGVNRTSHKLQSQRLRHIRQQEELRLHYRRQQHNYFQLQFNTVNSCQNATTLPHETLLDFESKCNYSQTASSKTNGSDATTGAQISTNINFKNDKAQQSDNILNTTTIRAIAILDNDESTKISTETSKSNNLLAIGTT